MHPYIKILFFIVPGSHSHILLILPCHIQKSLCYQTIIHGRFSFHFPCGSCGDLRRNMTGNFISIHNTLHPGKKFQFCKKSNRCLRGALLCQLAALLWGRPSPAPPADGARAGSAIPVRSVRGRQGRHLPGRHFIGRSFLEGADCCRYASGFRQTVGMCVSGYADPLAGSKFAMVLFKKIHLFSISLYTIAG